MLIGDMAIKNLAPKDNNSSGRIIKNMRICGSGLYEYHKSEAALMGLPDADKHISGDTFKVYRPADVLVANKDLYARVPIITGHHVRVNTGNAKQLAVGMVGDTVQSEVGDDGETYLYTTGTIIAGDGIEAYEKYGELSVGYDPIVEWCAGDYKGEHYDAKLTGFNEINHLLICPVARGGHQCMIMDSIEPRFDKILNGGKHMNIFKKIFGAPKQQMSGDARVVSATLQAVKAGADAKTQIESVRKMMGDSVDETLNSYFEELSGDEVKQADAATLGKAIDIVDEYCQKLLGDAHPENCTCPECKDKKEPGDADVTKKDDAEPKAADEFPPELKDKDCDKKDEPKQNGDALQIDYEKLASMVADKLKPAPQPVNGDEKAVSELQFAMGGDEKTELTSDSLLKSMF